MKAGGGDLTAVARVRPMSNEPIGTTPDDPASPVLDEAQLAALAGFGEQIGRAHV